MAPPGTKVVIHKKPLEHTSWPPHGVDGWYLGPAINHYCCYCVQVKDTGAECISDTVDFPPSYVHMPKYTAEDVATHAALDLIDAIQKPPPRAPFHNFGSIQRKALCQLVDIFQQYLFPNQLLTVPNHAPQRVLNTGIAKVLPAAYPRVHPATLPRVPLAIPTMAPTTAPPPVPAKPSPKDAPHAHSAAPLR
eukprot:8673194-Ditylum_brightwellii.AAC.1